MHAAARLLSHGLIAAGMLAGTAGCAPARVHFTDNLQGIQRVAVVDVSAEANREAVEYFTNEFVSLGFEVVERSNLGQILKEGFAKSDYLDQETLAAWGRGKAVQSVVLFKLLGVQPWEESDPTSPLEVCGWVRMVDVETGVILLAYNATYDYPGGENRSRTYEALQRYAERVVDDLRRVLDERKALPGAGQPSPAKPADPARS